MKEQVNNFVIRFDLVSAADGGHAAQELMSDLDRILAAQGVKDQASVEIRRDRPDTQDFGATLLLVLGTPAVLAIAKGVHDWIAKRGDRVVIETPDGRVVATGDGAKNINIAETAKALANES